MPLAGSLGGATSQMAGNVGAGLSGLLSAGVGFFQKKQGNKLLSQNPYPTYAIPQEILANQQKAQNMANEGLPSEQYQLARKNIDRQQAAAINAATDRRGGIQAIGSIQQGTNDAYGDLDAKNAAARGQNERTLMDVNNTVAGYRDKAFDWNQKNKYLQNYGYAMSLLSAGNQNLIGGIDKLAGGLIGAGFAGGMGGGGGKQTTGGRSPYVSEGNALADTGAQGYVPGSNTDIIMNPNAYTSALIR